jgi:hypothetical protein
MVVMRPVKTLGKNDIGVVIPPLTHWRILAKLKDARTAAKTFLKRKALKDSRELAYLSERINEIYEEFVAKT